jgi:hypothetical protein
VRGTLTTEVWETQNQTWLEVNRMLKSGEFERDPGQFFEWVKFRSHLSRGVTVGTMLMDESLYFMRMGTFLERADNTARLLDVKFHAVQNDFPASGSAPDAANDFYHWSAILRSVSGFEVYRKVYRDVITPERVAGPTGLSAEAIRVHSAGAGLLVAVIDNKAVRVGESVTAPDGTEFTLVGVLDGAVVLGRDGREFVVRMPVASEAKAIKPVPKSGGTKP